MRTAPETDTARNCTRRQSSVVNSNGIKVNNAKYVVNGFKGRNYSGETRDMLQSLIRPLAS